LGSLLALAAVVALVAMPGTAAAQTGRIVCWKDKAGKVVGCGDKVPPEYQANATREMDSRGVTRKTSESLEETNRRREKEQEAARLKTDEDRKALDQKRQDTALMETYSNEKEIDLKRDRDIQVLDLQLEQLNVSLKNTTQRYEEAKARVDGNEKSKKPVPPALKEELSRVTQDKQRFEQSIATKQKEKEELRAKYAEYRKRYSELRAAHAGPAAPSPSASARK
jgi:DNA repair exonuclease SbcCD ATPase subunit